MIKWQFIINRISQLISTEGKEIVVFNVEAERNAKRQFEKYHETCEIVKDKVEAVVTTSLPGEERIFWPNKNAQFYIREGEEKVPQDIEVVLKTSWRETKEGQKSRIVGIIFCVRQLLGVPSISGEVVNFIKPHFLINPYSKFDYSKELEEMARIISMYPDWI